MTMYKILILGTLLGMVFCDHHDDTNLPPACRMPPDTNDCGGSEQRWFYHPNLRACSKFLYKGCQNSPNHFATREECEKLCLPPFEEKKSADTKTDEASKDSKDKETIAVDEPKQTAPVKTDSATTIIPEKQLKIAEKAIETVKQKEAKPTVTAEKDSKNNDVNDDNDTKEDDEEMEHLVNEQDEMRKRFDMADSDDFLTLEQYMQDDNMDISDILPAEGTVQEEGDILGTFYEGDDDREEVVQEITEVKDKKEDFSKAKKDETKPQQKFDISKEESVNNKKNQQSIEGETEKWNGDVDNNENGKYLEEMIEEEKYLEDRFGMADSDDMLALQEVMQSPDMQIQEVLDPQAFQIPENKEETINSKSESQPNNEEVDEDLEEVTTRREQFSMADNADYMALEDIMGNPGVQEMEIIQDNGSYNDKNRDEIRIAHMEISNSPSNDESLYNQNKNSKEKQKKTDSDGYGEHLDHTHTESHQGEENEEDATIRFEEELEKQFHMADRDDMLSLEEMIQDPNMDMGEIIPSDTAGEKQPGDINGVLSMAASFLGEDSKEQNGNFKAINKEIQQLPAIVKNPINEATMEIQKDMQGGFGKKIEENDFQHPADKLEEQINDKQENVQSIDIEKMRHNDKMMLISLLHLDGLKVNKIAGTTTPVLKPFKNSEFLKNGPPSTSPNKDFFEMLNIKGIRKCCLLPRDPGPCKKNKILQWHFDPMIGTCLPFFYGGCKGNRNRFDTIGECLRKCGSREVQMESLPEPIPEPPTSKSSLLGLKSMISGLVPGKILSLHEKMSPGQQKFIHKFIKSALKHVTDIKPVKIGPFFPNVFSENRVDSIKVMKPPVPLKSVMFKWPMLKMVFDKRTRDMAIPGRLEAREGKPSRIPIEKYMGLSSRDFRRRGRDRDESPFAVFRQREREFEERGRDRDENPFKDFRKRGRENKEDENPFNDFRTRGREHKERYSKYKKHSKHFSPSFKKSYKMMSHHEDNRHQISSDPKNKVNLIQVFVNKPNTESNSNPTHHHTMIKKQFSPEPQIKAPLPPPPPINRNTPPQAFPPQPYIYPQAKPLPQSPVLPPLKLPQVQHLPPPIPPQNQVIPPMQHQIIPPPNNMHARHPPMQHQIIPAPNNNIHAHHHHPHPSNNMHARHPPMQHQIIPALNNNIHAHHHHPHYHHEHPPMVGPHTHFHVHHPHPPPMMQNYPHQGPTFFDHPKPWWARFDRPYYEPPFHGHRSHIRPSTGYPHKRLEEPDNRRAPPEKDDVVVATMPPGESDGELHYACLLPVSTGMCKAFVEKYYFNRATGGCEMFIYGGCGGNANNYGSKEECQATCMSTSPVPKFEEATTRPDDTIIITSPVYVPNSAVEKVNKEDAKQAAEEPVKVKDEPAIVKVEKQDNQESDAVKVEPVSLFKSTNTEYIIVIAVMCFVGLAVVVLVALAVANFSKKTRVSKKERVLEAVLSSHLEGRSTGTITPRSLYYGHPPSEIGPPPISDVPKIHKETFDEQL